MGGLALTNNFTNNAMPLRFSEDVQLKIMREIDGLEQVEITQPGANATIQFFLYFPLCSSLQGIPSAMILFIRNNYHLVSRQNASSDCFWLVKLMAQPVIDPFRSDFNSYQIDLLFRL